MKLTTTALTALWMLAMTLAAPAPRAEQGQSTTSGVYTDAQATRGADVYAKACSSCHGASLEGDGFAPALNGAEFMANWTGTTVGDFYERIRVSMPPGQEDSVTAQEKADIVGYILKANKFPAGSTELGTKAEALKQIKFDSPK
jgi:mono/diheme cytochrome c family protein